jgi:uncharacterized membrane protein YhhN
MRVALGAATAGAAMLAIAAAIGVLPRGLAFVFKPLATGLILFGAWPRGRETPAARRAVLVGLSFSLAGDVFLLWPKEGFLPGLVSFLLAHLAYLVAFTREQRLAARPSVFVFYAAVGSVILGLLWNGIPAPLRIPVLAYVVCLVAMAAQAAVLWLARRDSPRHRGLAIGGALFMTSDALLATNRFMGPLPLAGLWILTSYWAAQWLIASWLAPPAPRARPAR